MDFDNMELPELGTAEPAPSDQRMRMPEDNIEEFGQESLPPSMRPAAHGNNDDSLTFMAAPRGMVSDTVLIDKKALPCLGVCCVIMAISMLLTIIAYIVVWALLEEIEDDINHLQFKIKNVW